MSKNDDKKNINLGITISIIGIIANAILIILNFINDENMTLGIVFLCVCSALLCVCVAKKNNK